MPGADRQAAQGMVDTIHEILKINNQFYSDALLSISLGFATSEPGESMEALMKQADDMMYENKRLHYASQPIAADARRTKV